MKTERFVYAVEYNNKTNLGVDVTDAFFCVSTFEEARHAVDALADEFIKKCPAAKRFWIDDTHKPERYTVHFKDYQDISFGPRRVEVRQVIGLDEIISHVQEFCEEVT
jgi:hypothetical protein